MQNTETSPQESARKHLSISLEMAFSVCPPASKENVFQLLYRQTIFSFDLFPVLFPCFLFLFKNLLAIVPFGLSFPSQLLLVPVPMTS